MVEEDELVSLFKNHSSLCRPPIDMPAITAHSRHRLEDYEFKISLGNLVRHYFRRKKVLKHWLIMADIWTNMITAVIKRSSDILETKDKTNRICWYSRYDKWMRIRKILFSVFLLCLCFKCGSKTSHTQQSPEKCVLVDYWCNQEPRILFLLHR